MRRAMLLVALITGVCANSFGVPSELSELCGEIGETEGVITFEVEGEAVAGREVIIKVYTTENPDVLDLKLPRIPSVDYEIIDVTKPGTGKLYIFHYDKAYNRLAVNICKAPTGVGGDVLIEKLPVTIVIPGGENEYRFNAKWHNTDSGTCEDTLVFFNNYKEDGEVTCPNPDCGRRFNKWVEK